MQFPPVEAPETSREQDIRARLDESVAGRSLGRMADIGAWVASVQQTDAPQPFSRARAVVVLSLIHI